VIKEQIARKKVKSLGVSDLGKGQSKAFESLFEQGNIRWICEKIMIGKRSVYILIDCYESRMLGHPIYVFDYQPVDGRILQKSFPSSIVLS
jgi:hypothetical protein